MLNNKDDNSHDDQLSSELMDTIGSIIKKEGYTVYAVTSKLLATNGGNYLGELYQVDVKGNTAEGDKETHIFLKKILPDYKMTTLNLTDIYSREVLVYNELSKIFKEFQDSAKVPLHERYNMVKSYDETNLKAIVLENVAAKGYKTLDRMKVIPLKFAEISIQQLARFHGLSFVLQKMRPEYYEEKIKVLKYPLRNDNDFKNFFHNVSDTALENLHGVQKEKFRVFSENISDKFSQCFEEASSTICCLSHGDYRSNNLLVKDYKNEEMNVIPVDYQLLHYGCPVIDLIYFIYLATDRNFRKDHMINLKNMYYESLKKFVEYFDIAVQDIYPKKVYEDDFTKWLYMGLIFAVEFLPFILLSENRAPDLSKDNLITFSFDPSPIYSERIREIVDEFTEWGYL